MATIRSFSNSVSAALAQAVLLDHGIECFLADENSHLYSGVTIAIPIRLLASEKDIEQARQLLDSTDLSLPPDFDPLIIEQD